MEDIQELADKYDNLLVKISKLAKEKDELYAKLKEIGESKGKGSLLEGTSTTFIYNEHSRTSLNKDSLKSALHDAINPENEAQRLKVQKLYEKILINLPIIPIRQIYRKREKKIN